jgi:hypothetical protein
MVWQCAQHRMDNRRKYKALHPRRDGAINQLPPEFCLVEQENRGQVENIGYAIERAFDADPISEVADCNF